MSVPCWYSDSKSLIVKGANLEAIDLFGYPAEEFLGMNSMLLLSKHDVARMSEIRRAEKWGPMGTFTLIRKDGRSFAAELRWHQGEYRGSICDCVIVAGIPFDSDLHRRARCECDPPSR